MPARDTVLERYRALNAGYGSPFIWSLTNRGFYSEVNNTLNAVLYGLLAKRRLIVDDEYFGGLRWADFFRDGLPMMTAAERQNRAAYEDVGDVTSKAFRVVMRPIRKRHSLLIPIWLRDLGVFGSVFQVKRTITEMFAAPLFTTPNPAALHTPYAAFHVRRGDKTNGFVAPDGNFVIEGEATPLAAYLDVLNRHAPGVESIFLMSDDGAVVEELSSLAAPRTVVSFTGASETGYDQTQFSAQSIDGKKQQIMRLQQETAIAARSAIFVGGYKSNVARYVPLIHQAPKRCFSIDSLRKWSPR